MFLSLFSKNRYQTLCIKKCFENNFFKHLLFYLNFKKKKIKPYLTKLFLKERKPKHIQTHLEFSDTLLPEQTEIATHCLQLCQGSWLEIYVLPIIPNISHMHPRNAI